MGIMGMIGKVAGSKVVETVENKLVIKKNREQTGSYCNYIKINIVRICKMIAELENETKTMIDDIAIMKDTKLFFKEKGNIKKAKEKASKNLQYLYLVRDFFIALSKNASGLILQNEELMLVTKFAPFFDGVPVLDINDRDNSLMGEFKELGREFKEVFISSKRNSTHFEFNEYMHRYEEKLGKYIMPDIDSAIESFKNAIAMKEDTSVSESAVLPVVSAPVAVPQTSFEEMECPNCHTKIQAGSKFCLECGNKIEIKKHAFCSECGAAITSDAKFCSGCGSKIV